MTNADRILLQALGLLSPDESQALRHDLAVGAADPADLTEWEALVAHLDEAPSVPAAPFDRIRSAVQAQRESEALVAPVAELVDTSLRRARYLLRMLHDDTAWLHMYPGCRLMHIRPGPKRLGLDVGFVSLDAGTPFPQHEHLGEETVLVVAGELVDLASGERHGVGARVTLGTGSVHAVMAGPDEQLVYLVVVGGIQIPGIEIPEAPPEALV
jgi:quercetin dioxygenase-like cupin family protein